MNRIGLALIALAAAGAGAWLVFGPLASRTNSPDESRREGDDGAPPAVIAGPVLQAAPGASGKDAPSHRGRCSIAGTVREGAAGVEARIEVVFLSEPEGGRSSGPGSTAYLKRMLAAPAPPAGPTAKTNTRGKGRYLVEGVAPGTYRVTAITEGGARGSTAVTLPVDGARVEADLLIGSGAETLSGRVVHVDGRPFTGAVFVDVAPPGHTPLRVDPGARVPIDASGRFVATGLVRGEAIVTAIENDALRVRSKPVAIPHRGEFVLTLDAGLSMRTGRVLSDDDGKPISGATVMGGGRTEDADLVIARTTTDAQGQFEIRLPAEGGGVRALAPGFAPSRLALTELPLGAEPIEIRLARGARLIGRVTSIADGKPVQGTGIRVIPESRATSFFPPESVTTDADGHYEVGDLAAGDAVAFAEGDGWVTEGIAAVRDGFNPLTVTLKAGEVATLDLRVVRATSATGVVLDASGAPISGAVVRAEGRQGVGHYSWLGAIENTSDGATATGADGSFAIPALVGGASYLFTATAPDGSEAHTPLLRADVAQPLRVEIRFAPVRRLEVTVLDSTSGAPVPGAQVLVSSETGAEIWRGDGDPPTTGPDGKAVLVLRLSAALSLIVQHDDYLAEYRIPVAEGAASVVVRLSGGFAVAGRVLLPDGSPAVGADVSAKAEEGNPDDPTHSGCTADSNGAFRFAFPSPGRRMIRATLQRGTQSLAAAAAGTAGGDPIVLTLAPRADEKAPPGALVVLVLDPSGKPVPAARVELHGPNSWDNEVKDGRAEFHAKERDESWVEVWDAAASDGSPLPLGPARSELIAATTNEVVIRLPPEKSIEGVVRAPDGNGVRGATVAASWGGDSDKGPAGYTDARTGTGGLFRIGRLGSGECSLTVDALPDYVSPEPVKVAGGATGIEIRLRAAVHAQVTVVDYDGQPVPWAVVSLHRADGSWWSSRDEFTADQAGVARLVGLDGSDVYRLDVRGGDRRDVLEYSRESWKPADTTVRLELALRVKGFVRDPSGRPIEGAKVFVTTADGIGFSTETKEDGAFSLNGLAAGEVALSVGMRGSFGGDGAAVRVAAGTEDVVLALDPGLELVVHIDNWSDYWIARSGSRGFDSATLFQQGAATPASSTSGIGFDGTAHFRGLAAGRTYTLWVYPGDSGLSLLQRDVSGGSREIHVSLLPGKSITGRLTLPPGATSRGVMASREGGYVTVQGTVKPDGAYEILGLPDGTWSVRAWFKQGDVRFHGEADAPAGGAADLILR